MRRLHSHKLSLTFILLSASLSGYTPYGTADDPESDEPRLEESQVESSDGADLGGEQAGEQAGESGAKGAHQVVSEGGVEGGVEADSLPDSAPERQARRCEALPLPHGYQAGVAVWSESELIEYRPGELPMIIAAPHGGHLEPEELAEAKGELARDTGSLESALLVYERLRELTGRSPHLIINHVKRNRLNLNRLDARPNAQHPLALSAYHEFHGFVNDAKRWVSEACGAGHYFDFHTNGHVERWVEVGVGLSRAQLKRSDERLEEPKLRRRSFYRSLLSDPERSLAELVRGPTSIGGLLEAEGIRVVPSPKHPSPGDGGYFSGGFNSKQHGSRYGGVIDSTQLEIHFSYIRARGMARARFSETLAYVIARFMELHYGFKLLDDEG